VYKGPPFSDKTAKINFITSWADDIIHSSNYILITWCNEINFWGFVCVIQWWALHVVMIILIHHKLNGSNVAVKTKNNK